MCFFFLLETSISFLYTTTNKSLSLNILSIFLWNIDGVFFKPNGITSHSKCPFCKTRENSNFLKKGKIVISIKNPKFF